MSAAALPLPGGEGWGEGRDLSAGAAPLTLSLSPWERGPAFLLAMLMVCALLTTPAAAKALVPYQIVEDAIPASLTGHAGDPERGRAIVADRTRGLCVLCHAGPFPDRRFQGNLSPDLAGSGSRYTPGQLRLRVVDGRKLNPDTIMPSYYRVDGLARVGAAWQGRTLLEAGEIEDVVAFLATLKD